MFHVNEIYFSHVILTIEEKTKGLGAMRDGGLFNCIKSVNKPDFNYILPRQSIPVPITNIASLQLKAKVEGFSEQKAKGFQDGSLRNEYLYLLVLASYLVWDVPDNLKYLLEYREEISHSRWIKTASGYLRLLIFELGNFGVDQKKIVQNCLVYYMRLRAIFCAYPFKANSIRRAFFLAMSKKYPFGISRLRHRNSGCSTEILFKTRYLLAKPKNVALSVYAETHRYSVEAVKDCLLPDILDIKSH